jgi:hypothetical protein
MKHLEIFENKKYKDFWLVDYFYKDDHEHSYNLFPDLESAEIWIITIINNEREELEQENYNDNMFFTDIDEAMEWYEGTFNDIELSYHHIYLKSKLTPGDKLKMMRDSKKYNL